MRGIGGYWTGVSLPIPLIPIGIGTRRESEIPLIPLGIAGRRRASIPLMAGGIASRRGSSQRPDRPCRPCACALPAWPGRTPSTPMVRRSMTRRAGAASDSPRPRRPPGRVRAGRRKVRDPPHKIFFPQRSTPPRANFYFFPATTKFSRSKKLRSRRIPLGAIISVCSEIYRSAPES